MAPEDVENEQDESEDKEKTSPKQDSVPKRPGEEQDGSDEEEEEDEEPRLKYASLTRNLQSLYRNGDATSSFIVSGDKMVRIPV